jgi:hypothetical protein
MALSNFIIINKFLLRSAQKKLIDDNLESAAGAKLLA